MFEYSGEFSDVMPSLTPQNTGTDSRRGMVLGKFICLVNPKIDPVGSGSTRRIGPSGNLVLCIKRMCAVTRAFVLWEN